MRILSLAVLVTLLLLAPVADAGPSLATKAYRLAVKADRRAKGADRRSRQALAAVQPVVRGDTGPSGARGLDGRDGLTGSAGLEGRQGVAGETGADGANGSAGRDGGGFTLRSATNTEPILLGLGNTTGRHTVVDLTHGQATAGQTFIEAEGQAVSIAPNAGTAPQATPVTCVLELDGATVATREFDLAAGALELASVTASPTVDAGSHHVAFACNRTTGVSEAVVEFGAERARLTVLSG